MTYDEQNYCWITRYPWISDLAKLPNSFPMAFAGLKATEQRLKGVGSAQCAKYQEQVHDMLDRGVAEKLSKEEVLNYNGPTVYLYHHKDYKADSTSTSVRIAYNLQRPIEEYA